MHAGHWDQGASIRVQEVSDPTSFEKPMEKRLDSSTIPTVQVRDTFLPPTCIATFVAELKKRGWGCPAAPARRVKKGGPSAALARPGASGRTPLLTGSGGSRGFLVWLPDANALWRENEANHQPSDLNRPEPARPPPAFARQEYSGRSTGIRTGQVVLEWFTGSGYWSASGSGRGWPCLADIN